jgi:uncharacterized membrane protein YGL010W
MKRTWLFVIYCIPTIILVISCLIYTVAVDYWGLKPMSVGVGLLVAFIASIFSIINIIVVTGIIARDL